MAKKARKGSISRNKKAKFDYALEDYFTAGLVLTGPEIKSIRAGNVRISDAYCYLDDEDVLKIKGMYISEFKNAGYIEQDPHREKLLLLNKNEIKKIKEKVNEKGFALVPIELFISEKGYAKLEIALGKGKKHYDKRESLKSKDIDREIREY
ncbi:MAG: SsrA-binding protein SmpB [Bacteroidia bacterium]